jgi:PrsW family intramembrane metalloprotease
LIALKQALRGAGKFIVILAIAFAHVWGILQLIVLGSFARTVSIRTVLAAMAAGFYACAAFAALLESVWIGPTAWITGTPYADVVQIASYTVDPFIEEAVKIIPLAMLLLWVRVIRHQWSITDCIIVGAALGSGFGLAEDLYRFSDSTNAVWTGQDWLVRGNVVNGVIVPGLSRTMVSLFPAGVVGIGVRRTFAGTWPALDPHLALSAVGGLAVGLLLRHRGSLAHRAGIALLLSTGSNHALFNAALYMSAGSPVFLLSSTLYRVLWFVPPAAVATALWLDWQRQDATIRSECTLALEKSHSPPIVGTLHAAVSHLPWSLASVDTGENAKSLRIRQAT